MPLKRVVSVSHVLGSIVVQCLALLLFRVEFECSPLCLCGFARGTHASSDSPEKHQLG